MDLDLDHLTAVRVLGRGAMGTVFLVADRSPHRSPSAPPFFALKVVDRSPSSPAATKPDAERRARWEASVLARLSHPFLPSLLGRLETPDLLAWAVPYCPGGDLNALRHSQTDGVFSPSAIRFYVSELVLALAHLHFLGIAYRDLKPENVLIQASGHLTLTDFDLSRYLHPRISVSDLSCSAPPPHHPPPAKPHRRLTRLLSTLPAAARQEDDRRLTKKKAKSARVTPAARRGPGPGPGAGAVERSHSFVGTEEYVAPEVVRGEGHEFAVDWWALGVLAYEMAYGRTPFRGRSRKETFRNVLARQPEFVGRQPPELTDLIARLLAKDPRQRLGSHGGAEEVKAHPFFRGLRWELLPEVTRPPFLAPCCEDDEDVAAAGEGRSGGGFDVRDYFKKHQQQPQQPQQRGTSPLGGSISLTEF